MARRETILRNVRREMNAVRLEVAERLAGRYCPPTDLRLALRSLERIAVAVEGLADIETRGEDDEAPHAQHPAAAVSRRA